MKGIPSRRIPLNDASNRLNVIIAAAKPHLTIHKIEQQKVERLGYKDDPQSAYDFDLEVYNFMLNAENDNIPSPDLFDRQTNITPRMRTTVIDWLVDIHKKYGLRTDTLYIAINLMDLYLNRKDVDKTKYQRLACAALLVAAKSEEQCPPSVQKLVYVSDKSFTVTSLNRMEAALFATMNYHVNPIVSSHFVKRYLAYANADTKLCMMAHFINESLLLDSNFIASKPSERAAACVCLAMTLINGRGAWDEYMQVNTGYSAQSLSPLIQSILQSVNASCQSKFKAVYKKYSSDVMMNVSLTEFPDTIQL